LQVSTTGPVFPESWPCLGTFRFFAQPKISAFTEGAATEEADSDD